MDNREKLELLRQTVLAAAQRSAEETEAETKKIIEDTVSAEKSVFPMKLRKSSL